MSPKRLAIELAKTSSSKVKLGAVVVDKKGRVLAIGQNSYQKTHPIQAHYAKREGELEKIYLHAEIAALVKCRGVPYALYVARVNNQYKNRMAKPCKVCNLAATEAGIKKIHYTTNTEWRTT